MLRGVIDEGFSYRSGRDACVLRTRRGRDSGAPETFPTDRAKGLRPLLPHFTEALQRVLAKTETEAKDCIGIALGFAGLVDTRTGS